MIFEIVATIIFALGCGLIGEYIYKKRRNDQAWRRLNR